jgi:hypothetical protein
MRKEMKKKGRGMTRNERGKDKDDGEGRGCSVCSLVITTKLRRHMNQHLHWWINPVVACWSW